MRGLTDKETEILLLLFRDFSADYNANNITKKIKITPAGAFKSLKNLEKKKIVIGKTMGKARFYKLNLSDYYSFRIMEALLINEARINASRWLSEFKELFEKTEIVIIFGSVLRNPQKAGDIDILVVLKKQKSTEINRILEEKRKITNKPIHAIKQTENDLIKNIKENLKNESVFLSLHSTKSADKIQANEGTMKIKNKVILNAIRTGYVLHGYDKLLEVIKNIIPEYDVK